MSASQCEFVPHTPGKWICKTCNKVSYSSIYLEFPPKRNCSVDQEALSHGSSAPPKPAYVDPVQWMTSRYLGLDGEGESSLKGLLAKLDRCLSADCELLVDDVCTRWRGSACKHHERWFERLLLVGKCEHWKPIVDPSRPFS